MWRENVNDFIRSHYWLRKIRHLALREYRACVFPVVRRVHTRLNRRKVKAEIQMLENLWEGKVESDPTESSRKLDDLVRWLLHLKRFPTPIDFFFPRALSEPEARKNREEMTVLESFWPRDEDHIKAPDCWRRPLEEAKISSGRKPWETLGCWVKPYVFHTKATGRDNHIKVTKDLDSWEFTRNLERGVRSRLGSG